MTTPSAFEPLLISDIIVRLLVAAVVGAVIGYERRMHQKAIGIAGMMLVALGATTYMLMARHEAERDPAALGRTIQGILQGIGFLGGAVIFKGGTDVRGIKTAAAIWITGALGLAIATAFWPLGLTVGIATALILWGSDMFPGPNRRQEEPKDDTSERSYGKVDKH